MSDDTLIFYLPLDEIIDDKVQDQSLAALSGAVNGAGIVPDDLFGSCLLFDGEDDNITVDPGTPLAEFSELTLAFWACGGDTLPQNTVVFYACKSNTPDNRIISIHLPWGNDAVYWDCGWAEDSFDRIHKTADSGDYKGQWNHWAFTKNVTTGVMQIYLNGQLWCEGEGKTKPIANIDHLVIGSDHNGASHWPGKLSHVAAYSSVLSSEQIRQHMLAAQNAQAAFRTAHPLDFTLSDEEQSNVFYISEDDTLESLDITLENKSGQVIVIEALNTYLAEKA